MSARPPAKGDLVRVDWLDIQEDPTGDPDDATLQRRSSFGLYWERRRDDGHPVLVTTTTVDEHGASESGYCIYPLACIRKVRVIRRGAAPPR